MAARFPPGRHPPWRDLDPIPALFHIGSATCPPPATPPGVSAVTADFLTRCFQRSPGDRPPARDLLRHRFCTEAHGLGGNGKDSSDYAPLPQDGSTASSDTSSASSDGEIGGGYAYPRLTETDAARGDGDVMAPLVKQRSGSQSSSSSLTSSTGSCQNDSRPTFAAALDDRTVDVGDLLSLGP